LAFTSVFEMSHNPFKRVLNEANGLFRRDRLNQQYEILAKFSEDELNSFIPNLFLKVNSTKLDDNQENLDALSILQSGSFSNVNENNVHNYLAAALIKKHSDENQIDNQSSKGIGNLVLNTLILPKIKLEYEKDISENELYEKDFFFYFNYVSNERNSLKSKRSTNILVDTLLGQFNSQSLSTDESVIRIK
jgi:hypothetical protein